MSSDSTHTITRSSVKFLTGTLFSRATGLLRDVAMAFAFGTESSLAIFFVAFRFAHLARRLFGEGSLQNTFIPHFEELRAKDPEQAFKFFRDLSGSLALSLVGITLLGLILLNLLPSNDILKLTAWMLPSLIFICLYGLNTAFLSCEKSYFTASCAPIAFNLVWVLGAFAFSSLSPQNAMIGLSVSVVLGCCAQWAVTLPKTYSYLMKRPQLFSKEVCGMIKPLFLANCGVAASQINNALDPLFSLFANSEGPAWLWYSIRIQQLPLALFGIALSNALLPPISRALKKQDRTQFDHFYLFAYKKIAALTLLVTAGIVATAPTCVNLLFGRGQFTMESVEGTAICLIAYGIGLFPMAYVLITAPVLYAFGDFKSPSKAALITMLLSITLNVFFIFGLKGNAPSVAFSTSIAAFGNAYLLSRTLQLKFLVKLTWNFFPKILAVSLSALASSWLLDWSILGYIPTWNLLSGTPLHLSQQPLDQISLFTRESIVFLGAAALSAYLFQVKEYTETELL